MSFTPAKHNELISRVVHISSPGCLLRYISCSTVEAVECDVDTIYHFQHNNHNNNFPLPDTIQGRIVEIERKNLTPELRKRVKVFPGVSACIQIVLMRRGFVEFNSFVSLFIIF